MPAIILATLEHSTAEPAATLPMRTSIRFVLMWACLTTAAVARDILVSNVAGDDRRDGSAASVSRSTGPVRSISKALRLAQAGDRIVVENTGEPYRETLSLTGSRHGASSIGPLVIDGRGATLDGTVAIPPQQWQQHAAGDVFSYRPARLGHQQLFVGSRAALRRPARRSDLKPPRLEPLEWCFWQGRIYFRVPAGRLPADYELSCCGLQTGITLYHVRGVLIRDLTVRGFAVDGVAVHDVVRDTRLLRVTSRDNGASGVSVRGASVVELDDCTLAGNGTSQLRVADFARCWLYNCKLSSLTATAIRQTGGHVTVDGKPLSAGAD